MRSFPLMIVLLSITPTMHCGKNACMDICLHILKDFRKHDAAKRANITQVGLNYSGVLHIWQHNRMFQYLIRNCVKDVDFAKSVGKSATLETKCPNICNEVVKAVVRDEDLEEKLRKVCFKMICFRVMDQKLSRSSLHYLPQATLGWIIMSHRAIFQFSTYSGARLGFCGSFTYGRKDSKGDAGILSKKFRWDDIQR